MPRIKLKHIVSVSSEDAAQPAANLLKPEGHGKWRCANPGEKQVSVIIELEKETQIHAIDIGNNGAALVEVLVGRSSWTADEPYKVLLVTSSFMSPVQSKNFTLIQRVRIFGPEKMTKLVAEQKWDRVKVVCTQPFNLIIALRKFPYTFRNNEQYGLSFITLRSPPDAAEQHQYAEFVPKKLGFFALKDAQFDKIATGNMLFKQQGKLASSHVSSTAAHVRDASTASQRKHAVPTALLQGCGPTSSSMPAVTPVRTPSTASKTSDNNQASVGSAGRFQPVAPVHSPRQQELESKLTAKRKHEELPRKTVTVGTAKTKTGHSPPAPKKVKVPGHDKVIPLNQILGGVVFVLSGFKNPERGNLRDKALQMGAQYRPDWGAGCTHLICAFANTPKYQQVKGTGKIVTKKWITDSYKRERRLPSKSYWLPGDSGSSDDSESEEDATTRGPPRRQVSAADKGSSAKRSDTDDNPLKSAPSTAVDPSPVENNALHVTDLKSGSFEMDDKDDEYEGSTDVESTEDHETSNKIDSPSPGQESSSEPDTEDELKKALQEDDRYSGTTEDEGEEEDDYQRTEQDEKEKAADHSGSGLDDLPSLPDFFSNKHFLLYGELNSKTRRSVVRYVTAFNGTIDEYMNEDVDFVITRQDWDSNFDDALAENVSLAFVRPEWIFACHEQGALVPFQPYIIVP